MACGNALEAVVCFTRALELTAVQNVEQKCCILVLRGDAYEAAQREDLAKADYREVRRLHPRFHEPYLSHAASLDEEGAHSEAQALRSFIAKLFA